MDGHRLSPVLLCFSGHHIFPQAMLAPVQEAAIAEEGVTPAVLLPDCFGLLRLYAGVNGGDGA